MPVEAQEIRTMGWGKRLAMACRPSWTPGMGNPFVSVFDIDKF